MWISLSLSKYLNFEFVIRNVNNIKRYNNNNDTNDDDDDNDNVYADEVAAMIQLLPMLRHHNVVNILEKYEDKVVLPVSSTE